MKLRSRYAAQLAAAGSEGQPVPVQRTRACNEEAHGTGTKLEC